MRNKIENASQLNITERIAVNPELFAKTLHGYTQVDLKIASQFGGRFKEIEDWLMREKLFRIPNPPFYLFLLIYPLLPWMILWLALWLVTWILISLVPCSNKHAKRKVGKFFKSISGITLYSMSTYTKVSPFAKLVEKLGFNVVFKAPILLVAAKKDFVIRLSSDISDGLPLMLNGMPASLTMSNRSKYHSLLINFYVANKIVENPKLQKLREEKRRELQKLLAEIEYEKERVYTFELSLIVQKITRKIKVDIPEDFANRMINMMKRLEILQSEKDYDQPDSLMLKQLIVEAVTDEVQQSHGVHYQDIEDSIIIVLRKTKSTLEYKKLEEEKKRAEVERTERIHRELAEIKENALRQQQQVEREALDINAAERRAEVAQTAAKVAKGALNIVRFFI